MCTGKATEVWEGRGASKISVTMYQSTRRNIPEDVNPLDDSRIQNFDLQTGRNEFPWEF